MEETAAEKGAVTCLSFCVVGSVPLVAFLVHLYIFGDARIEMTSLTFFSFSLITVASLVLLGLLKTSINLTPWWKFESQIVLTQVIAVAISWLMASLFHNFLNSLGKGGFE